MTMDIIKNPHKQIHFLWEGMGVSHPEEVDIKLHPIALQSHQMQVKCLPNNSLQEHTAYSSDKGDGAG